jgi:hypothetical protein
MEKRIDLVIFVAGSIRSKVDLWMIEIPFGIGLLKENFISDF